MADGFTPIPLVQPGGLSLVSAEYANKIIVPLNALLAGKVAPIANVGSMKYAGGQFILDLSALDGRLRRLEEQVTVNAADLTSNVRTLENRINNVKVISNVTYTVENFATYVVDRMNNANISGSGSCSGNNITINVSLNL
jgi:hypothetical protein